MSPKLGWASALAPEARTAVDNDVRGTARSDGDVLDGSGACAHRAHT
jgi:hypothetical protein